MTEFARALTGWTVKTDRLARFVSEGREGDVVFVPAMHEPGARTIMGRTFADHGRNQALDILRWLAVQPQTARRLATKLARHFVSDTPPATLVDRLEARFVATNGDLAALARTLVDSPEAWAPQAAKFKTPNDFLLSVMRASGAQEASAQALRSTFEQLGQTPFRAPSPKGWPDTADNWAAPDAILKRVDWANLAAELISATTSPMDFARTALGDSLSEHTILAISRAESAKQGLVLAMMSPEFQRR